MRRALVPVLAAWCVLLLAACWGGDDVDDAAATTRPVGATETTPTPTQTATTLPAVTATPAPPQTRDWSGEQWDGGNVVTLRSEPDGVVLVLDRYGWVQGGAGPLEGAELVAEPLVYGNTAGQFSNTGGTLRTYLLAPDAYVGQIVNVEALCPPAGVGQPQIEPVYVSSLVSDSVEGADLAAPGYPPVGQDAITFGPDGRVTRVVFSAGC